MAIVVAVDSLDESLELLLILFHLSKAHNVHGNVIFLECLAELGQCRSVGLCRAPYKQDHALMLILVLAVLQC